MPDIVFRNSQKSEELRWRNTYREVANGWFAEHGFLTFPELRADLPAQIQVILPRELKYQAIDVSKYGQEWERVGESFWAELDHYLPEARGLHDKVVVDVGRVGTVSSSYWSEKHYYLRADRGLGDLAAMIINHAMYVNRQSMGITWTKREALMDFIMTRPAMKRLFPDFAPVYQQLLKLPKKAKQASEVYVRSLGIVPRDKELEIIKGKVYVRGVCEDKRFGKKERRIFEILLRHTGDVVSYDELADVVWGEGEFKSFWALAKLVERLRKTLSEIGLDPKRLESVRGQGYSWG